MSRMIFVNLPVAHLGESIEFFSKLGFEFNPQFTDETATCMIIGESNFVMLLTREKYSGFTPGLEICDTAKSSEVIVCLSAESRAEVDAIIEKGDRRRRQQLPRARGIQFHVRPCFPGSGWTHLGISVDGCCRYAAGRLINRPFRRR